MTEFDLERIKKSISKKHDPAGRIDHFIKFCFQAENQLSKIQSKITTCSTENDFCGLQQVFHQLKNFEEIDLLILTSVELSELEDDELSADMRNMIVHLENEKDSLLLSVTSLFPHFPKVDQLEQDESILQTNDQHENGISQNSDILESLLTRQKTFANLTGSLPSIEEDFSSETNPDKIISIREISSLMEGTPLSNGVAESLIDKSDMSTISELSEEDRSLEIREESQHSEWDSLQAHISRILSELQTSPFSQILTIFEDNYRTYPEFRVVEELIDGFMNVSVSSIVSEVTRQVEISKDFVYIQKSRILKLILILCAINCKFHGLDLNSLNQEGLSEVIEVMHYEMCLSTGLMRLFQLIVKIEETQLMDEDCGLVDERTCYSAVHSVAELYSREMSFLEQAMCILLLQRLYHYIKKQTSETPPSCLVPTHLYHSTAKPPKSYFWYKVALLCCALCFLLMTGDYFKSETFGAKPQ